MNTKLLSEKALRIIDQYAHFHIGQTASTSGDMGAARRDTATFAIPGGAIATSPAGGICSVPYFNNNRRDGIRAGLRALGGKGSPRDIYEEVEILTLREKIQPKNFTDETLKKFLVDHNIGIDCSGFAYYVLTAESLARDKGTLDRHLSFPFAKGIMGAFRAKFRPAENTNVRTLAHNKNSRVINPSEIQPGDFISMLRKTIAEGGTATDEPSHILIIHQVEYQNFIPITIHYTHSMAWPTDGVYGHGIRTGRIEITDPKNPLLEQRWIESEKINDHFTYARATKSITEIRRLNWF
ncbi:MAG: hypothetical protein RIT04_695 [Candidatus Parcubacteria bacterium]|jgi:hypothetical protein